MAKNKVREFTDKEIELIKRSLSTLVNGTIGPRGPHGPKGDRGESVIGQRGKPGLTGCDGTHGLDGAYGKDGIDGAGGKDGLDGVDGFSPSVEFSGEKFRFRISKERFSRWVNVSEKIKKSITRLNLDEKIDSLVCEKILDVEKVRLSPEEILKTAKGIIHDLVEGGALKGESGPMPKHEVDVQGDLARIRFENSPGSWGKWIDLTNIINVVGGSLDHDPIISGSLQGNSLVFKTPSNKSIEIDLASIIVSDSFLNSASFNSVSGVLTLTLNNASTVDIDLSSVFDNKNLSSFSVAGQQLTATLSDSSTVSVDLSVFATDSALALAISSHEGASDPHSQYTTSVEAQGLVDTHANRQDDPHDVTKAQVGLGSVDNTSDLSKPVSTAQALINSDLQSQIGSNDSDLLTIAGQQVSQDIAIALNTSKISADGSIDTHSDVDVSTSAPAQGDQLEFNGTNWVPKSILNGYTIFAIWAEENAALSNASYEWSWGNGSVGPEIGIPVGIDCEMFALSFNSEVFGTSVSVDVEIDGSIAQTSSFSANNSVSNFSSVQITAGARIGFRTNTVNGVFSDARICAWFRVKATVAFPTPDRSVVSGSSISFVSTSWATIPGMTTSVVLSDTGTVDGIVNYSALRSGVANSVCDFRIVIGGNNGQVFSDTLSTFNDNGSSAHFVESLSAGTYIIAAQAQVTEPITITSISLTATAVED